MSLRHELRINALEKRLDELEALVVRQSNKPDVTTNRTHAITRDDGRIHFLVDVWDGANFWVKRGFQGYYVFNGEKQVTDEPLKKAEANAIAEELNEAAA